MIFERHFSSAAGARFARAFAPVGYTSIPHRAQIPDAQRKKPFLATLMPIQPLVTAELNELSDFLESVSQTGATMALDTLHGYLSAIAIGPREPALEEWLPRVWSEDGTGAPAFKDSEHESRIVSLIEGLLEDIRNDLDDPDYAFSPLVAHETIAGRPFFDGEMWCYGFMQAVQRFAHDWASFVASSEGHKLLRPIYLLGADDVSPAEEALTMTAEQREKLTGQISDAVDKIADKLLEERIRAALPEQAERQLAAMPSGSPQTGQLCPCGSGAAFNACCGGSRVLH
ncbi:UPF0149 family protein [Azoarcus sp. KH32C]|uniref:UPF0149 family protein n=1 Tax=Azoarcus sp. KH32C TaxID=748247 RepID=UPI00023866ED|nr:UPF0149 family protein [Azoarcus sp. KH32C]BAL23687.1 hypothetical protein AZKH_1365 [Azoarcus sp. KH32C]